MDLPWAWALLVLLLAHHTVAQDTDTGPVNNELTDDQLADMSNDLTLVQHSLPDPAHILDEKVSWNFTELEMMMKMERKDGGKDVERNFTELERATGADAEHLKLKDGALTGQGRGPEGPLVKRVKGKSAGRGPEGPLVKRPGSKNNDGHPEEVSIGKGTGAETKEVKGKTASMQRLSKSLSGGKLPTQIWEQVATVVNEKHDLFGRGVERYLKEHKLDKRVKKQIDYVLPCRDNMCVAGGEIGSHMDAHDEHDHDHGAGCQLDTSAYCTCVNWERVKYVDEIGRVMVDDGSHGKHGMCIGRLKRYCNREGQCTDHDGKQGASFFNTGVGRGMMDIILWKLQGMAKKLMPDQFTWDTSDADNLGRDEFSQAAGLKILDAIDTSGGETLGGHGHGHKHD